MILKKILVFLIFYIPLEAIAYSIATEYQFFSQSERQDLNNPYQLDSEYFSDRLTYSLPIYWHGQWITNHKNFQYSAGSLGKTRFLTQNRLKIREELISSLDFQFIYIEQSDFEQDLQNMIFEFFIKTTNSVHFSVYGQPKSLKSDDDVGLSINWSPQFNSTLRVFYTWIDFSNNERTESAETYEKTPAQYGLIWRSHESESHEFQEISLVHHEKLRIKNSSNNQTYSLASLNFEAIALKKIRDSGWNLQGSLVVKQGFEEDTSNLKNTSPETRWQRKVADLTMQALPNHRWVHLFGLQTIHRHWEASQGGVIFNDLLPHMWINLWRSEKNQMHQIFRAGLEGTWHRFKSSEIYKSHFKNNGTFQQRFNLKYDLGFSDKATLAMLLTFDIDDFGTGEAWEGGNMQFLWDF